MATAEEFERQVFAKEGIRIVIRDVHIGTDNYKDYSGRRLKDDQRLHDFTDKMDTYLKGTPYVVVDGTGQKPWHRSHLSTVRASYGLPVEPATVQVKANGRSLLEMFKDVKEVDLDAKLRRLGSRTHGTTRRKANV